MKHKDQKVLIVCTTDSMITNFLIPHINDLKARGHQVDCACSRTGQFMDMLVNDYHITTHEIDFHRSPFSFANFKALKELNRLVKKVDYDVIFCHEPVGGAMGRVVGHLCGKIVVYMAHGFHFFKGAPKKNYLFYIVEKFLAHWTDVLITINREDYEASQKFVCKNRFILNGIGIDTSKFYYCPNHDYIRRVIRVNNNKNIFCLSVGELIPRKNHETVIRAIAQTSNKNIHYIVAGDGELKEYLYKLSRELGVSDRVHLLGYRTDINQLCNACDIYLLPSLQEGLSVALMEGMATGNAIIASRIRGNVDLIDENKGGILVAPKDIDGYANAISKLAETAEKRDVMGQYNVKKIKEYDIEFVRHQMSEVFDMVFSMK